MYRTLSYNGVKGTSESIHLDRTTVLTGPNESGKSAAAEAFRLAVTGKCELGSSAASQQEIVSGGSAMAVAAGDGIESSWTFRSGKKQHESDPALQGSMPLGVGDFWSLTGAERLKLIANEGALTSIESQLESLEAERKQLKTIIDAMAPIAPAPYSGPSIDSLKEKQQSIHQQITAHRAAMAGSAAIASWENQNAKLLNGLEQERKNVEQLTSRLQEVEKQLGAAKDQLARYEEESAREPRIVKSARARGVTFKEAISDTAAILIEALEWAGNETQVIKDAINAVQDSAIPQHPLVMLGEARVDVAVKSLQAEQQRLSRELSKATSSRDLYEANLKNERPNVVNGLLSGEEYANLMIEKESSDALIASAGQWKAYESALHASTTAKVEASSKLAIVEEKIKALKDEMAQSVAGMKDPVESLANQMLAAAGEPALSLEIKKSGRHWSLGVRRGPIAIEAVARSKRLLYGLCLVAAIHELSSATCPILIAECAEMEQKTLDSAIRAMSLKKKGNVILEHWTPPKESTNTINFSKGIVA